MASALPATRGRLSELAVVFLRLGILGFGGPAAHIAMMRDEVVRRRRWMTDQVFLDLVGATNLIPGPNSTEMAIHIGYARAGWRGLLVAGACFIIPAMVIVMAFAWAYTRYGTVAAAGGVRCCGLFAAGTSAGAWDAGPPATPGPRPGWAVFRRAGFPPPPHSSDTCWAACRAPLWRRPPSSSPRSCSLPPAIRSSPACAGRRGPGRCSMGSTWHPWR